MKLILRNLIAILFLTAYLFNLAGYNMFYSFSIYSNQQQIRKQLDLQHYSDDQLVELKIKLNLPYMNDWANYERFDGELEYKGTRYNYVKRKIVQDTLYILCLPDQQSTALYKAKSDYAAAINDFPVEKDHTGSSLKSRMINDQESYPGFAHPVQPVVSDLQTFYAAADECPLTAFVSPPGKPPDSIA